MFANNFFFSVCVFTMSFFDGLSDDNYHETPGNKFEKCYPHAYSVVEHSF